MCTCATSHLRQDQLAAALQHDGMEKLARLLVGTSSPIRAFLVDAICYELQGQMKQLCGLIDASALRSSAPRELIGMSHATLWDEFDRVIPDVVAVTRAVCTNPRAMRRNSSKTEEQMAPCIFQVLTQVHAPWLHLSLGTQVHAPCLYTACTLYCLCDTFAIADGGFLLPGYECTALHFRIVLLRRRFVNRRI